MAQARRYSGIAIFLHWTIAVLIAVLIGLGLTMTSLKPGSSWQFKLYQLHKSIGMTVLALVLLRLAWRIHRAPPDLPQGMPGWERRAAHGTHMMLYALMIAMPLIGWMMVSSSPWNIPTVLYGVLPLPHLPILSTLTDKAPVEKFFERIHGLGAWILMGVVGLHFGAALKHYFFDRDDVLQSMLRWPFGRRAKTAP
jgi:cytochrome b561